MPFYAFYGSKKLYVLTYMPYMPHMVQKNFMSLLICPICLIWFKKTLCPYLYVLLCLLWLKKKTLCPYLYVLLCLLWFKKTLCPYLYVLLCLLWSKKTLCPFLNATMVQKNMVNSHFVFDHLLHDSLYKSASFLPDCPISKCRQICSRAFRRYCWYPTLSI
jgi:hypothetical protein